MQFSARNFRMLIVLTVVSTAMLPCVSVSSKQLLGADRFAARGTAGGVGGNRLAARTDGKLESNRAQMREGTLIPPTSGRIVLVGRRWAFVPNGGTSRLASDDARRDNLTAPTSSFASTTRTRQPDSRLQERTDPYAAPTPKPEVGIDNPAGSSEAKPNRTNGQMLVTENVMLQRIVEAIRIDAADDRWTISGEVTEFFDQNRLIIRTAQRANSD